MKSKDMIFIYLFSCLPSAQYSMQYMCTNVQEKKTHKLEVGLLEDRTPPPRW